MMMKDVKDAIARGRHQSHPTMLKNMRWERDMLVILIARTERSLLEEVVSGDWR